jgi:hypothetical protein
MLRSLRNLAILALALAGLVAATPAKADPAAYVNLNFASGATFSGTLDFTSDYSQITGVSGILTDYQLGSTGFVGSGIDPITWIWAPGANYASGTDDFGNFLMDGSPDDYSNSIAFTYNYSSAPTLYLAPGDNWGVGVNGYAGSYAAVDPLVSGTITVTPEPGTLLLLGSGLVGFAGMLRRKIGARA